MNKRFSFDFQVQTGEEGYLCDLLHQKSGLSKGRIKEALKCGACRIQTKKASSRKRTRKAKKRVQAGDLISFYYDQDILSRSVPAPKLICDLRRYSVWDKPAGMLSQGSQYADHCSMLRQVEILYQKKRQVYLVHRLDREASGIFVLAHDKKTAAQLSGLFRNRLILKKYSVEVLGNITEGTSEQTGRINTDLDGKTAETVYTFLSYSPETNSSKLIVQITGGRFHQIRRHLNEIHHPVMGDPRYGIGNKNTEGLRLRAIGLSFDCPLSLKPVEYGLEGF